MKYLFCNRVNFTWGTIALSFIISNLVITALLALNLFKEDPNSSLAIVAATLLVSPAMFMARKRWYPEAHEAGHWAIKLVDARVFATVIVFDLLARSSSSLVLSMMISFSDFKPAIVHAVSLAVYVVAAVIIGRYLSQRILPSKALATS